MEDPAVIGIRAISGTVEIGFTTCTGCGRENVQVLRRVRQRRAVSAWYYSPHPRPVLAGARAE
jgi:hypothetical protein